MFQQIWAFAFHWRENSEVRQCSIDRFGILSKTLGSQSMLLSPPPPHVNVFTVDLCSFKILGIFANPLVEYCWKQNKGHLSLHSHVLLVFLRFDQHYILRIGAYFRYRYALKR